MKKIVISVGGSLLNPGEINTEFISNFKKLILSFLKKNYRFILICGGGALARDLQSKGNKIVKLSDDEKDWLGINATHINAFFLRTVFGSMADSKVIKDPTLPLILSKKVIIAGGWKPGWSTDYDAVLLAKNIDSDTVINMSNVEYLYTSDPKIDSNAVKIKKTTWAKFSKIIGTKWKPGLNAPFDPIAAKEAAASNLKVHIIGPSLSNLRKLLIGKSFVGTTIK